MTLYINGTSGISGVDGSAGTPAIQGTDANTGISFPAADTVAINTGGSERSRVDSSGRLLVGTSTSVVGSPFSKAEFINTSTIAEVVLGRGDGSSAAGDTIGIVNFSSNAGGTWQSHAEIRASMDAASGNNDKPGRLVFSTTADGSASPTERMRIEDNGRVNIGKTAYTTVSTNGHTFDATGWAHHSVNSDSPLYLNRNVDDGNLIAFYQAGTLEGSISVSGSTVAYNGAHLSRWSQIEGIDPHDKDQRPEILRGTVMSNLDEMCDWIDPGSGDAQDNEQLNKTKVSDVEGDKNVAGVFQSWDDDDDTWVNDYYLAMTGDFIIRIAGGVTVERGDLLMSAGDGTAKPQDDDIIRSKTIAKVTSTNVSCTYADGSYCVPCVLMAC